MVEDGKRFEAIGFRMGDRFATTSGPIDLVFTPQLNRWTGSERIELEVKDLMAHPGEKSNDKNRRVKA
jgi:hypothetical protein